MERDDAEGAKAAAEYFLGLYPYVYATGDLLQWEAMSHAECKFCASVVEDATALVAEGGYGLGGEVEISDVKVAPPDEDFAHFRVAVMATEAPSFSYSASGEVTSSAAGGEVIYTVAALWDGGWTIRAVSMEEP